MWISKIVHLEEQGEGQLVLKILDSLGVCHRKTADSLGIYKMERNNNNSGERKGIRILILQCFHLGWLRLLDKILKVCRMSLRSTLRDSSLHHWCLPEAVMPKQMTQRKRSINSRRLKNQLFSRTKISTDNSKNCQYTQSKNNNSHSKYKISYFLHSFIGVGFILQTNTVAAKHVCALEYLLHRRSKQHDLVRALISVWHTKLKKLKLMKKLESMRWNSSTFTLGN